MVSATHPRLEIGRVQRNYPGEDVCGDAILVSAGANHTLIAVADGLGHGREARHAALAFCDALAESESSLADLMRHAHRAIAGTRGVAAMILRFDHDVGALNAVGVGNVECHALSRSPIRPHSTPGIVGHRLRRVTELTFPTSSGDWLALVSDGISRRVNVEAYRELDAQRAAELIVQDHSSANDDSSCVVIKVR
jgi:negative regulator of sigma-B (phosphoserine phosphatase)